MQELVKFNEISGELRKLIPVLKPGETVQFRLKGAGKAVTSVDGEGHKQVVPVFPASRSITNRSRIFDPGKDDYVDIAYIKGVAPAGRNGNPARYNFGEVEFLGSKGCVITCTDKDKDLLAYLSLLDINEDSVNPGKVPPPHGYVFERIKPEADAATKLDMRRKRLQAAALVEEASPTEFNLFLEHFKIPTAVNNKKRDRNELMEELHAIAESNPDKIILASTDEAGRMRGLIRDAEKYKLIEFNDSDQQWQTADSKQKIVGIAPGKNEEDSLLGFLQLNHLGKDYIAMWQKALEKKGKKA